MATPSTKGVVRAILSADINLTADEVIRRAKLRGVTAPDSSIRLTVHKVRSDLKRNVIKPVPVAARATNGPKPAAARPAPRPAAPKPVAAKPSVPPPAARADAPADLTGVFANVALVNTVVGVAGGIDQARQVAEAVRSCGGVEAFLKHLELVAGIRGASA